MIPYLTIAVYSSAVAHRNLMIESLTGSGDKVTAHEVLKGNQARLFDATDQALLCENFGDSLLRRVLEDSRCPSVLAPGPAGCYQAGDGRGPWVTKLDICAKEYVTAHSFFGSPSDTSNTASFYCQAVLGGYDDESRADFARDFWFKKFEHSTVPYHETLHSFGEHTSNWQQFGTKAHLLPCPAGAAESEPPELTETPEGDEVGATTHSFKADWDWLSIHGSQIVLLLSMSINDNLSLAERWAIYSNAEFRAENRLCQTGGFRRTFDVPPPPDSPPVKVGVPAPATPSIPPAVSYDGCQTGFTRGGD